MESDNKSKSFESLKKDIEYKLKEIKAMQEEIKDSLHKSKEVPLLLNNNIEKIKDKITHLKEDITTKTNIGINKIISSIDAHKNTDLEILREKVNTLFKNKDNSKS